MKVGDLVMYNLGPATYCDDYKDVAIIVAEHLAPHWCSHRRNFRIYYPHYNDFLNGWEDEYRVISS